MTPVYLNFEVFDKKQIVFQLVDVGNTEPECNRFANIFPCITHLKIDVLKTNKAILVEKIFITDKVKKLSLVKYKNKIKVANSGMLMYLAHLHTCK